jgi:NADH-ubiquinone oxidoreductase-G iron-sulfur binding region
MRPLQGSLVEDDEKDRLQPPHPRSASTGWDGVLPKGNRDERLIHGPADGAFDRILSNHVLYCTVCDNNNGNCTVHNATKLLAIEGQKNPVSIEALQSRQYQSFLSL